VGEFQENDVLSILAASEQPSLGGVRKGKIENERQLAPQLAQVFHDLQEESGEEITENIFVAVTGAHVNTVVSTGVTRIRDPEGGVTREEIESAIETAQTFNLDNQQKMLHLCDRPIILPDGHEAIFPVGAPASKIEAQCMIVFGRSEVLDTTRELIAHVVGNVPVSLLFSGVAAGLAALNDNEIDQGALVIDLGGGVTEYAVYKSPGCFYAGQITVGCEHVINDLHAGLRLHGSVVLKDDGGKRRMPVGGGVVNNVVGKRMIPVSAVEHIVDLRLRELFTVIREDLRAHNALERIHCGIKLCGGGALLPGIDKLARDVFEQPVTIASPRLVVGERSALLQSPRFVTPVGLLRLGRIMLAGEQDEADTFWQQFRNESRRIFAHFKDVFRF
jgi:cell division protein FtsA